MRRTSNAGSGYNYSRIVSFRLWRSGRISPAPVDAGAFVFPSVGVAVVCVTPLTVDCPLGSGDAGRRRPGRRAMPINAAATSRSQSREGDISLTTIDGVRVVP